MQFSVHCEVRCALSNYRKRFPHEIDARPRCTAVRAEGEQCHPWLVADYELSVVRCCERDVGEILGGRVRYYSAVSEGQDFTHVGADRDNHVERTRRNADTRCHTDITERTS